MRIVAGLSPAGFVLTAKEGREWFKPTHVLREGRLLHKLIAAVLRHGGHGVVIDQGMEEIPLDELTLARASQVGLIHKPGLPNNCHQNAERLVAKHPRYELWFGWYRDRRDRIWRAHSWCRSRGRIVETTVPSEFYLGIRLTG